MRGLLFLAVLAGAAGLAYWHFQSRESLQTGGEPSSQGALAQPDAPRGEAPQAEAQAAATPHPAKEATAEAVRLYPALAQRNSPMNVAFVALYNQKKTSDPVVLTQPDWPVILAHRAASTLGIKPVK